MNQRDLIRASLSSVRKELAEVFPHLDDDLLGWAPTEGMRTVQGQFVEILSTEQSILDRLQGLPRRDYKEIEKTFWAETTVEGLIRHLAGVREATLRYLDRLDDEAFNAPVPTSEDFANWLELESVPASEMFRFLARHESYHAGQLVAYLWARGDNPYEWE